MYSREVLKIFNNPKHSGRISKPDGIADCYNFDETLHVEFSIRVESGIVVDCQFRAQANPYVIAVCEVLAEMAVGKMVVMFFLDENAVRERLSDETEFDIEFCINCLKNAVIDYKEKLEKKNK